MKLTTPIAIGNTAEVYDYEPGWILKLFKERFTRGAVEYEFNINRAVEQAGIPVPKTGAAIIEIDGRFGILYEKIDGQPMAQMLKTQPWKLFEFARKMAELHVRMHAEPMAAVGIPSAGDRNRWKIEHAEVLSDAVKEAALEALESMPKGDRLCHGDFHLENILIQNDAEYIIDWVDAMIGSPMMDVARSSITLQGEAATQDSWIIRQLLKIMDAVYVRHYFRLSSGDRDEFERWLPILAAGRLCEGLDYQQDWLMAQAEKLLVP